MKKGSVGRKPLSDPPIEKTVNLPSSLVAEIELRLFNPLTEKVQYGAFAKLVESLLRDWLARQQSQAENEQGTPKNSG